MLIKYKARETESYEALIERLYKNRDDLKRVHDVTFQVTEDCCLKCSYCYQHHKTKNKLSFETAKQFIDDLLNDKYKYLNSVNTKGIILDFIGGEPLLEINLIKKIVEYTFNQMIIMNHPWLYYSVVNISSNGVLYETDDVQDYFLHYGFLTHLSISIDGNKELHDSCRIDHQGNGSYDKAISAVKKYRQQFHREAPTKMTLAPDNIQYLSKAIFNLIQENYKEVHLNCAYEPGWTIEHAKIMYQELKIVADYIIDNNLYNKIFISLFNEDKFQPMLESNTANWCGGTADGSNLALNYTGQLFPCIRYMESSLNGKQPPLSIGEVGKGLCVTELEKQNYKKISNITRQSQSSEECLNCLIAEGCGWCSAYNYEETGSVNHRVTYICIMHQANALANVYYWNKLYKKLNIDKIFNLYLNKTKSLQILNYNEYQELINLTQRR